jgi:hypothetical protein
MATRTDHDPQWAAQTLGVTPSDPAAARAAFLRRLPAAGFVPPPELVTALRICAGVPVPENEGIVAEPAHFHDRERQLRDEIDDFTRRFWTLPAGERRSEWRSLLDRCDGYTVPATRVRRLEPGLDIPPVPTTEIGDVAVLAREVQELFVLGAAERATRRRELLDDRLQHFAAAEAAARRLQKQYPTVAALEPVYLKRLANYSAAFWKIAATRRKVRQPNYKLLADAPAMTVEGWMTLFFFAGLMIVAGFNCGHILSSSDSREEQPAVPSHNSPARGKPGGP